MPRKCELACINTAERKKKGEVDSQVASSDVESALG